MIKIAIDNQDDLYRYGIESLLSDIFSVEMNKKIEIENLTTLNFPRSDIIVKNFDNGMKYICHPLLKKVKPNCLVIGLYEGREIIKTLPSCVSNTVLIKRSESVDIMKKTIIQGWKICSLYGRRYEFLNCSRCTHQLFTPQQILVSRYFYHGISPRQTADEIGLSPKTFCSHKRSMMHNLDINTDCDFLNFLHIWFKTACTESWQERAFRPRAEIYPFELL
jgi:DNA-binding NarL/FixJ family response regulator